MDANKFNSISNIIILIVFAVLSFSGRKIFDNKNDAWGVYRPESIAKHKFLFGLELCVLAFLFFGIYLELSKQGEVSASVYSLLLANGAISFLRASLLQNKKKQ